MRESRVHALSVYLSSALVVAAWVAALVYFKVVDSQGEKKGHWDLWSWTCNRKSQRGNIPWAAMCIENVSLKYPASIQRSPSPTHLSFIKRVSH